MITGAALLVASMIVLSMCDTSLVLDKRRGSSGAMTAPSSIAAHQVRANSAQLGSNVTIAIPLWTPNDSKPAFKASTPVFKLLNVHRRYASFLGLASRSCLELEIP